MQAQRHRTGFTLIELLVVIAIIAILAAILFPVFIRAQASARKGACQAHAHELVGALTMYADDYGRLPYMQFFTWTSFGGVGTIHLYTKYVKNEAIILCPQKIRYQSLTTGLLCTGNGSYAYNECLIWPWERLKQWPFAAGTQAHGAREVPGTGRMIADVPMPSKIPVFFDAVPYHPDPNGRATGWGWGPEDATNSRRMTNPHNGGANYAFLDGHVIWQLPAGGVIYMAVEGLDYDGDSVLGSASTLR